jgi:hypothetical protein
MVYYIPLWYYMIVTSLQQRKKNLQFDAGDKNIASSSYYSNIFLNTRADGIYTCYRMPTKARSSAAILVAQNHTQLLLALGMTKQSICSFYIVVVLGKD